VAPPICAELDKPSKQEHYPTSDGYQSCQFASLRLMLKYRRIIQDSARRIAAAAKHTVDEYTVAHVEHEPEFTGVMLGGMKEAMHGYITRGVKWTAKILTSQGPNAQENTFGADFMGVVEFDLPEYRVKKGFLAQAKRIEQHQHVTPGEWNRMAQQCQQMLAITPESLLFVYARSGIIIVPALTIASATAPTNPHDFYSRNAPTFYRDHFECFVGDRAISSADIATLERLRARNSLYLGASPV
jgi:hypothetical protein